jgi:PAS domain S-box-containing protein
MSDPTETARLQVLHSYGILDTPREPAFDDIVTLATQICAVPVGLVSLVAADRQWFKAGRGFPACETPLSQSVCVHALAAADGLMVIPDLTADPRTRENTLVTGAPFIRFYAGAVLRTDDGVAFGTLCVIDTEPRPAGLRPDQAFALQALAQQVIAQLELRRAVREREVALAAERAARVALAVSEERYRLSSRATTDLIWDWNPQTGRIHWDEALSALYGYQPAEIEPSNDWWYAHIHPEDRDRVRRSVQAAIEGAPLRWSEGYRFRRADGTYATVLNRAIIVRTAEGTATRMTGVMLDATQQAEADAHREMLSQELSHRLKNTLAMVQAIASQTLRDAPDVTSARDALLQRLLALGKAHDILLAGNAERAGMEAVIRGALALHDNARVGRLRIEGPPIEIGPKAALALALMIHELATNAAKFGALSAAAGHVAVTWQIETLAGGPQLRLSWVESDGPPVVQPSRKGFGTRLIERAFAGTVAGDVALDYQTTGLHCVLTAPLAGFQGKDGILS